MLASDPRFTAAVTFNDVMAAGMMRTCHQRHIQLPEALSIVGFDDIALAKYLHPALTTVHYPIEKMARRAARLALQIHSGSDVAPRNNRFRPNLSCETQSPTANRMSKASAANERRLTQRHLMKPITWPVACAHILQLPKPLRCCSTPSSTGAVYG